MPCKTRRAQTIYIRVCVYMCVCVCVRACVCVCVCVCVRERLRAWPFSQIDPLISLRLINYLSPQSQHAERMDYMKCKTLEKCVHNITEMCPRTEEGTDNRNPAAEEQNATSDSVWRHYRATLWATGFCAGDCGSSSQRQLDICFLLELMRQRLKALWFSFFVCIGLSHSLPFLGGKVKKERLITSQITKSAAKFVYRLRV